VSPGRPLDDVELLLIDGNNLLHRTAGSVEGPAVRSLLAQLQQAVGPPVQTVLMLDGHAAPGTPSRQRISGSLEVRQAGSVNADDAIIQVLTARPYSARARTLVVSDDRSLVERARSAGGRTQRLGWLQALMARPSGTGSGTRRGTIGRSRPPMPQPSDDEREPWRPGRGATRKRGNPRRGHPAD
jgi:hypothetical protein